MEEQQTPSAEGPKTAPKSRALWIAVAVIVVVVVVLLAAVLGGLFAPTGEDRVLKIGTVLSITGGLSAFGTKNRQGVIMAVDEINAAGGVLGRGVEMFHQNDDTKPGPAIGAAATVISQNRVDTIIGATGSGQCAVVLEVAKANSVFEISGSCTSPVFSNDTVTQNWWARTAPSDALQGVVASRYAETNLTFARAAVIGINNAYGVGLAQVFHANFIRFGGTMVAPPRIVTEVQFGALDYTNDLRAILNTAPAPQLLYVVAYPPDGILLMKNFEAAKAAEGWGSIQILFSEGVFEQAAFIDVLRNPPNSFDPTPWLGTAPSAYGGLRGPDYSGWSDAYKARWGGTAPGLFDDNNYDAAYLVALAAQRAGTATGTAIRDNIVAVANPPGTQIFPGEWSKALAEIAAGRDIDYEGASGSVNIDSLGDPFSGYVVWGVNAQGQAFNKETFDEALVRSYLPSPPAPATVSLTVSAVLWNPMARTRET